MLAYHNSVFLIFVVSWIAFTSGITCRVSKEMGGLFRPFLLLFLIFHRAPVLNSATLTYVLNAWSSWGHQFLCVLSEIALFLLKAIFIRK